MIPTDPALASWARATMARWGVEEHPLVQYTLAQVEGRRLPRAANDDTMADERTTMAPETPLMLDGVPVGMRTPQGAYLDRHTFVRLHLAARLRAYLLLAYPASRTTRQLARVCQCTAEDAAKSAYALLHAGFVRRLATGVYRLTDPTRQGRGSVWQQAPRKKQRRTS